MAICRPVLWTLGIHWPRHNGALLLPTPPSQLRGLHAQENRQPHRLCRRLSLHLWRALVHHGSAMGLAAIRLYQRPRAGSSNPRVLFHRRILLLGTLWHELSHGPWPPQERPARPRARPCHHVLLRRQLLLPPLLLAHPSVQRLRQ